MRKWYVLGLIISVVICAGLLLLAELWPQQGLSRTPLNEHKVVVFEDAGLQMQIPAETPFVSSNPAGVLVMLHQIKRGFQAEAGYIIQVHVMRKSKASMNASEEFASKASDELQQWRHRIHSVLDVRKAGRVWCVRKDIETPKGDFLSVDGEITVTEFADTDLAEVNRMIGSIAIIPTANVENRTSHANHSTSSANEE
jgi:hypothetical protein